MDLVILDGLGYLPFSQAGGALLLHQLSMPYEHTSVMITSNLDFAEWSSSPHRGRKHHVLAIHPHRLNL